MLILRKILSVRYELPADEVGQCQQTQRRATSRNPDRRGRVVPMSFVFTTHVTGPAITKWRRDVQRVHREAVGSASGATPATFNVRKLGLYFFYEYRLACP